MKRDSRHDDSDDMQLPTLIKLADLERILHLDRNKIARMCRADLLPKPLTIGASQYWKREDIERLLKPIAN